MKKKFLTILSLVFVLAFAVAVYALNQTNKSVEKTASCCAKSDSCLLKDANAKTSQHKSVDSCCGNADCCCKGDSCPMKSSSENASDCCDNCCGGSCPMKEKQTAATDVQTEKESCPYKTAGS